MNVRLAKILLLPYMGFGLVLVGALNGPNGVRPFLNLLMILFAVCAVGLTAALAKTKNGGRFLGMDRGLWVAGSCLACVAGGALGFAL